jgi:hypothetical protein
MNGFALAGGLGAALIVACSLWFADHVLQSNVRLTDANEGQARELVALATALDSQAVLREALDKIDRQTRAINSTLDGQTAQLNRNLAELKRTDEKTNAYLAELVPVALGLRYQRPETTDPVAYRASAVVQPGAVSPAGSAATGGQ